MQTSGNGLGHPEGNAPPSSHPDYRVENVKDNPEHLPGALESTQMNQNRQDYTELDQAILAEIAKGNHKFDGLSQALQSLAQRHCEGSPDAEPWRVIDRRLQALRKKNLIMFSKPKACWITPETPRSN